MTSLSQPEFFTKPDNLLPQARSSPGTTQTFVRTSTQVPVLPITTCESERFHSERRKWLKLSVASATTVDSQFAAAVVWIRATDRTRRARVVTITPEAKITRESRAGDCRLGRLGRPYRRHRRSEASFFDSCSTRFDAYFDRCRIRPKKRSRSKCIADIGTGPQ